MKAKKPPNPFKNQGRKDLPPDLDRERIRNILGHGVDPEFAEWYRQDWKPGGYTTPGMKYQGPGNSTNIGEPVNDADALAQKHDLQYAHAAFRYAKNTYTLEQYNKKVSRIDEEYIKNNLANMTSSMNPLEQIPSAIGAIGIGFKYGGEAIAGQQYPSTDPSKAYSLPKEEGKMANKMMQTLQKNVSTQQTSSENSPMEVDESSNKREAEADSATTPTKQPRVAAPTVAAPEVQAQAQMNLPGTAAPQAGGGSGGDEYSYHAQATNFGQKSSTYKKQHKVQTFGLISDGFEYADPVNAVILPTCLAEIPWHIPALYLTPNEFDLLPAGAHCTNVKISVTYRKSTVQFATNATTTQEAVLNQLTDVVSATALNKTGWGSDYWPTTFGENNPMKVTKVKNPVYGEKGTEYRGLVYDLYGTNNDNANFTHYQPKVQLGVNWILRNYFSLSTERRLGTTGNTYASGGWPNLWEKVTQYDGDTIRNTPILQMSYQPKMGLLKSPIRYRPIGYPMANNSSTNNVITVPTVGHKATFWNAVLTRTDKPLSSNPYENNALTDGANNPQQDSVLNFTIYTPIEKSQWMRSGPWGEGNSHVQPSAHIGVQPIPALSTGALIAQDDATIYTTTKGYFLIDCEMTVVDMAPTVYPFGSVGNSGLFPVADVPYGDQIFWATDTNKPANFKNTASLGEGPTTVGALKGGLIPLNSIDVMI
uniref:VP1 n=1 Tax=Fringilla montifringilla ambidensovirus TaxID=2794462 RepID=A0A8A4XEI4_9VIRU|nr:MAG: VP1 [Fringilla montifringilla ambidensovirus]